MSLIFVFLCPTSVTFFSMITSRPIHVASNGIISFFWMSNIPLYIWASSSLSIQHGRKKCPVSEHFSCFHVLAVVNSAAMNVWVPVSFKIMVFSKYLPSSEIEVSYGSSVFSFLKKPPYCSP